MFVKHHLPACEAIVRFDAKSLRSANSPQGKPQAGCDLPIRQDAGLLSNLL